MLARLHCSSNRMKGPRHAASSSPRHRMGGGVSSAPQLRWFCVTAPAFEMATLITICAVSKPQLRWFAAEYPQLRCFFGATAVSYPQLRWPQLRWFAASYVTAAEHVQLRWFAAEYPKLRWPQLRWFAASYPQLRCCCADTAMPTLTAAEYVQLRCCFDDSADSTVTAAEYYVHFAAATAVLFRCDGGLLSATAVLFHGGAACSF